MNAALKHWSRLDVNMKAKVLIGWITLTLLHAGSVLAQATFHLQNIERIYGIDAPVFDAQGLPLAGTNYEAELWGGATPDALVPALNLRLNETRLIVPFSSGGYFFSAEGFLAVPALPPGGGGYAWLQVRAWDASLGGKYEDVASLGIGGYGESPQFYAKGGDPFKLPPDLSAPLIGLQSFSLRPVPEPCTWTLLALSGMVLWGAARHPRRPTGISWQ